MLAMTIFLSCACGLIAANGAEEAAMYKKKIITASDQITCEVCKEAVADIWEKSTERLKRGDETDEDRIEKFVESKCTTQGLEDDYTIREDSAGKYVFNKKTMEDYQAEGGVVETITNPDGTTSESMTMQQTVTSQVDGRGNKRAIDPKTWKGLAIQQACRNALIIPGTSTVVTNIIMQKFWPEEDAEEEDLNEAKKFASSEEDFRKHICQSIAKVCAADQLARSEL